MDDVRQINEALRTYPQAIYTATQKSEKLRESWQLEEARKDYELAKAFLSAKAMGLTVGEAERKATEEVYPTAQRVIIAESSFRRSLADQMRLENEFTGVRKRAEMLKLTESHMRSAA